MTKERPFTLLLATLFLLGLYPNTVVAQTLSLDNFAVSVGADYSMVKWDYNYDNPYTGDRNDLNINPHVRLSYRLPITKKVNANIQAGYSRLGFFEEFERRANDVAATRQRLKMQTLSLGIEGLIELFSFEIGMVYNWRAIMNAKYLISQKRDDQWNNLISDEAYGDKYLADNINEVGFTIQRPMSEHLKISIAGLYGLNDLFSRENQLPGQMIIEDVEWYLQHYRVSVGYSF